MAHARLLEQPVVIRTRPAIEMNDATEILEGPMEVFGEPVLPGFVLDVRRIWAAMERKKA
jgi:hypothetical protein